MSLCSCPLKLKNKSLFFQGNWKIPDVAKYNTTWRVILLYSVWGFNPLVFYHQEEMRRENRKFDCILNILKLYKIYIYSLYIMIVLMILIVRQPKTIVDFSFYVLIYNFIFYCFLKCPLFIVKLQKVGTFEKQKYCVINFPEYKI